MSAWHYKLGEEEHGPVPFGELVRLVRHGTVTESVPVRRNNGGAWVHAWTVPALFALASRAPSDCAGVAAEGSPTVSTPYAIAPAARASVLRWGFAAGAALTVTLVTYRWWSWRALRFPTPPGPGEQFSGHSFPFYGNCSVAECALLYVDLAVATGAIAWLVFDWLERRHRTL